MERKSTVDEIRRRFDADVERFSNLETGQSATIDAPLVLELITGAAAVTTPHAKDVLDIGCGAGNYTLKLLSRLPDLNATLIDLSHSMLERAVSRVSAATRGKVKTIAGDLRQIELGIETADVVMAAAVLHHLREESEWRNVFASVFAALRPGGSFWISDLIHQNSPRVQKLMWKRYGEYLVGLKDPDYRDHVFGYVEKEDTPRPLMFQIDLLRSVGFIDVDILHKNSVFAAFGGTKPL